MDSDKIIKALNSSLRREILKIISLKPLRVNDVLDELNKIDKNIKYRTTVYRSLEKLSEAELVEKIYIKGKGLCYELKNPYLKIDLSKNIITQCARER